MSDVTPVKKRVDRPSHPDGQKYNFDCCPSPDVWDYSDNEARCRVCGKNWTNELDK